MHTFQIAETVLDSYKNDKLGEGRINLLLTQVSEQLDEISQNKELYDTFLKQVNVDPEIDNMILWILFMSNESICCKYISVFEKDFRKIIPVSDLADLLLYITYLKKVQQVDIAGLEYLLEYKEDGIEEMDQYAFTNVLLYIQKSKEVDIEF